MRAAFRLTFGGVVLLAAAIALAPAEWLDRPLAARTLDRLRLIDASGVWWNGRGTIVVAGAAPRVSVAWRMNFAPLLRGALSIEFRPGGEDTLTSGTITARGDTVDVRDLQLRAPAAIVAAIAPALRTFALGGDLSVQAPALTWQRGSAYGTIDAQWHRARLATGEAVVDFGTITLTAAAPPGERIAGTIRNDGGDVAIDGTLTGDSAAIDAALTLKATSTASTAVRQALSLLGSPDAAGAVKVAWRSAT